MLEEKKKILICIDWFEPAFKAGGPIRSVKNMVELLKEEFEFYILTSDRDMGEDQALQNVIFDEWQKKESYSIYYLSKENRSIRTISQLLKERPYHRYYFNSLFSIWFTLIPLFILERKHRDQDAILAPRGMLGKGALQIKSGKKKIFLILIKFFGLFHLIKWHASTEFEEKEIQEHFGPDTTIWVAKNVAQKPKIEIPLKKDISKSVKFIFLSRITSKKNLLGAISYFENLNFHKKVFFDIYGPIEDKDYWQKCQQKIESLNSSVQINYRGSLERDQIEETLIDYHFLLFPTKSENFGHNIAEALSSGIPVIISDQTPWLGLKEMKAGWDIDLSDKEAFSNSIQAAVGMDNATYTEWSKAARDYAGEKFYSEEIYKRNKELFE